jgi:protein Tex
MDYVAWIANNLKIRPQQVNAAVSLLDTENTIPFIARYRKEATEGLDEEQLWQIKEMLTKRRALEERRETVIRTIREQGNLSAELNQRLLMVDTTTELEDLYQPYKPKRKTRASIAREKGLQGLADLIIEQSPVDKSPEKWAVEYISEDVPDIESALAGARDIVAEMISDHPEVRKYTRIKALENGIISALKIEDGVDPKGIFEIYYEFVQPVSQIKHHQVLALNRAETDKVIRIHIEIPEKDWQSAITRVFTINQRSPFADQFKQTMEDSAKRLLLPTIERDIRRQLREKAEKHAIHVFADNLRALLKQPPIAGHTILSIDPGYRTGCKLAIIDPTGKVLDTGTIYPHEPRNLWQDSISTLRALITKYSITLIAIGNGTASRETEQLAAELTRESKSIHYLMVSEAGASVYSASPLARDELPEMDVSLRGAVSIARRIQDPLAEYVKIDPRSIGVGLYQHDVDQKELSRSLDSVVEIVVNAVGVDLNTASPALLKRVSGIGPKMADRIVEYRNSNGVFRNRDELLSVNGFGPKVFEQSAGFLRIMNSENPLDSSAIHPESYSIAVQLLNKARIDLHHDINQRKEPLDALRVTMPIEQLAGELNVGLMTLEDIFDQLIRPGRDPRQELPKPILRDDVLKMEDLTTGMNLKGTVRNVVDFGAFVDIGVKQNGLLHRSQLPKGTKLEVGQVITVQIISIDQERGRISLRWQGDQ